MILHRDLWFAVWTILWWALIRHCLEEVGMIRKPSGGGALVIPMGCNPHINT